MHRWRRRYRVACACKAKRKQAAAGTHLTPSLPSLPQVTTKKGPEFHYLPRYVRVANEHTKAATARSMVSMSKSGPASARV